MKTANRYYKTTILLLTLLLLSFTQEFAQGNWPAVNFQGVQIGTTSASRGTTICSSGGTIVYTSFQLLGATDFSLVNNSCSVIPEGQCCSINFRFSPRAGGARQAFYYAYNNSVVNPIIIPFIGTGTINPNLVGPLSQADSTWATQPYGEEDCTTRRGTPCTMRSSACTLTALTMAVNYAATAANLNTSTLTPVTMQDHIDSVGAFTNGSGIAYRDAVNTLEYPGSSDPHPFEWRNASGTTTAALDSALQSGNPVLVRVSNNSHTVLVIGTETIGSETRYRIVDPGHTDRTSLDAYGNNFQIRGYVGARSGSLSAPLPLQNLVEDKIFNSQAAGEIETGIIPKTIDGILPPKVSSNSTAPQIVNPRDLSSLTVSAGENTEIMLIDPLGRRTGFDAASGQILNEIPQAFYYSEANIDPITNDPLDSTELLRNVNIEYPLPGKYQIILTGLSSGNYKIDIKRLNIYGKVQKNVKLSGTIQSGATVSQNINYTPYNYLDFDGDGKTDISTFRPASGEWWVSRSSSDVIAAQFGTSTDKIVPGDFTGDGKTDIAIFRPSSGEWFILRSENGTYFSFPFGTTNDLPIVGDFDADGKADPGVFRPSNSTWFISKSSGGTLIRQFGTAGDIPVVADYDGDGKSDIAIFRPSVGQWWIARSSSSIIAFQFGTSTDKPLAGDYTGDGKADAAFFRPSTGLWFVLRSEDSSFFSVPFGTTGDLPVPGDYDGDGRLDFAVYRPSNSTWFIQRTTDQTLITQFGAIGDRPVPNAFVP